tara:strand:+ start:5506 stop:6081 length:576 start_codon:yes stop_codon:yes gene_type:complete
MTNDKEVIENKWTDAKWAEKVELLQAWIKLNKKDESLEDTIDQLKLNIKRGNKNMDKRPKAWASMLAECRDVAGTPIGGTGGNSNYPQEVQDVLELVHAGLVEERKPAHGKYTSLVEFRRSNKTEKVNGKDEKIETRTRFNNATDRAEAWADGRISMLKKLFDEEKWDGTEKGLLTMAIEYPQPKVTKIED